MKALAFVALTFGGAAAQPAFAPPAPPPAAPSPGYVAAGAELATDSTLIDAALAIEGGYRLGDRPLALHALAARGTFGGGWMVSASGDFTELRAGIETDNCSPSDRFCVVVGADVGYQHLHSTDSIAANDRALLGYGRLGIVLQRDHLRLAGTFDLYGGWTRGEGKTAQTTGGGFVATIGYSL